MFDKIITISLLLLVLLSVYLVGYEVVTNSKVASEQIAIMITKGKL